MVCCNNACGDFCHQSGSKNSIHYSWTFPCICRPVVKCRATVCFCFFQANTGRVVRHQGAPMRKM